MLKGFLMASVVMISFCSGLLAGGHGDRAAAGLIPRWRAAMPQNVPKRPVPQQPGQPVAKEAASSANVPNALDAQQQTAAPQAVPTTMITLPLNVLDDPAKVQDEFAIRDKQKYARAALADLYEDIKLHGLLDPPQVVRGPDGKWRIIAGHRRLAVLWLLANDAVPGFSADMQIQVVEVQNAPQLNLFVRSVVTNELGEKLDDKEKLVAVQKLDSEHASPREIATSLKISEKTVERDLRITRNPRLHQHVMDDNLPPTTASALAQIAAKAKRLDEFLNYLDAFVARMKKLIEDEERRNKQETGKGLRPNQALVKKRLEPHVVRGWMDALAKNKPLTEEPDLGFLATFDKKRAVATIRLKVDAMNDPVEHLARAASQVSQVAKHLAAFARKRHELEAPEGPQAALDQDLTFLDHDLLREFDLEDLVGQLESELPFEPVVQSPTEEGQQESTEGPA
jgi:ParB-like chromosome segregation protein Spo0J